MNLHTVTRGRQQKRTQSLTKSTALASPTHDLAVLCLSLSFIRLPQHNAGRDR